MKKDWMKAYAFLLSFAFCLKLVYPHFLHRVALGALRALHFMQIFLLRSLSSASLKRAISNLCADEYERPINILARRAPVYLPDLL